MAEESLEVGISKLLGVGKHVGSEERDCPSFQRTLEKKYGNDAVQSEIVKQLGVRL